MTLWKDYERESKKEANKFERPGKEWRYNSNGLLTRYDVDEATEPENFNQPNQLRICMNCSNIQEGSPCKVCGHEELGGYK